MEQRNTS